MSGLLKGNGIFDDRLKIRWYHAKLQGVMADAFNKTKEFPYPDLNPVVEIIKDEMIEEQREHIR